MQPGRWLNRTCDGFCSLACIRDARAPSLGMFYDLEVDPATGYLSCSSSPCMYTSNISLTHRPSERIFDLIQGGLVF